VRLAKQVLVLLVAATVLPMSACRTGPPVESSPSNNQGAPASTVGTEALSIGVTEPTDGELVATGILGRAPSFSSPLTPEEDRHFAWALFSQRGTPDTGPEFLAFLGDTLKPGTAHPLHKRFLGLEGELVTVRGLGEDRLFTEVKGIEKAKPMTERQRAALGTVLKLGMWWTRWNPAYLEFWEAEPRYKTLEEALPGLTFRPLEPVDSPAGNLIGVGGDDFSGPEYRGVVLYFDKGYTLGITPVGPPANDPAEFRAEARGLRTGTKPPYPARMDVTGHLGVLQGFGESPKQLAWQDDEASYVLMYVGRAYDPEAPSGETLLAIAESCYR